MKTIAVINQKGGVGKSTTAQSIGAGLKHKGYKVLFIDLDAQGNLTYSLGINEADIDIMDVMTGTDVKQAIIETAQGDAIASTPQLARADSVFTEVGKEYTLKEALEPVADHYDFIVIDTPPAVGILTINALTCCNEVVIPAQADIYSLQGVSQLHNSIETVKKYCNHNLNVKGILLNRYNSRAIISRDITDELENTAEQMGTKVFNTRIRECTAIKEAQTVREDIFTYAPRSNASADYNAVIEEIIDNEQKDI